MTKSKNNTRFLKHLKEAEACEEAIVWVEGHPDWDAARCWQECKRGDWVLWIAGRAVEERGTKLHRAVALAACECARTALQFVPVGDLRPEQAIDITERWARGDDSVTREDIRVVSDASWAAAWAASSAAALAAASATAWAATSAATWAATSATAWAATRAAASAAAWASSDAARDAASDAASAAASLSTSSDIARKYIRLVDIGKFEVEGK